MEQLSDTSGFRQRGVFFPTVELSGNIQGCWASPICAFGNSDGDFEMMEWTTSGPGPRFGGLVHHTDSEREWVYDRQSPIGRLERGLDEGAKRGWLLVGMANDWKRVFPANQSQK